MSVIWQLPWSRQVRCQPERWPHPAPAHLDSLESVERFQGGEADQKLRKAWAGRRTPFRIESSDLEEMAAEMFPRRSETALPGHGRHDGRARNLLLLAPATTMISRVQLRSSEFPQMIGKSVSHYEITALLGEGGMGQVYRASDTKLKRDVALKILPESFAQDPQRMGRFQREAEVLASLNHPNIAGVYGLEREGETHAIAMELVEGETLAARISKGAIPLAEALKIALQIVDALEAAHEKGIIHRDLKPANVIVTPEGAVKVLDFGLAKAMEPTPTSDADLTQSPTLTMQATQAGIILGTAAYMSPEQAKGLSADQRSDIWSFGALLFEMLAGKKPFVGDDITEVLASVVKVDLDWSSLPSNLPTRVSRWLRRCLRADPRWRWHSVADIRVVMQDYLDDPVADAPPLLAPRPTPFWKVPAVWVSMPAAMALAFFAIWFSRPGPEPPRRLEVSIGADASLASFSGSGTAALLSPDGSRLALVAQPEGGQRQLYVRQFDQLRATPLSGTEWVVGPFFSPDGQWIGFFADRKLKKISVTGGAAIVLCEAPISRGGDWGDDGSIVFAAKTVGGLSRVSSAGGIPQDLTTPDQEAGEVTHRWPQLLPGSQTVLFTAAGAGGQFENANLVVQSIPTGERKIVQQGGYHGRYLPSGHLVYVHEGTLFAGPFDVQKLELTGQAIPILEGVLADPASAAAQFAFSRKGAVVYLPGVNTNPQLTLNWLDRKGEIQPLRDVPAAYQELHLAPDGDRLALQIGAGASSDIWVYESQRDTLSRITLDPGYDGKPLWSPSGDSLVFHSSRDGARNLYWKSADGSGQAQRLTESLDRGQQVPNSWHPTGKYLAFFETDLEGGNDIRILALDGDDSSGWKSGQVTTFFNSSFSEQFPAFSPDGRWLAYQSNESGQFEIYVRPFPGPGRKWPISSGGGTHPSWSKNGREFFYLAPTRQIMVATYTAEGETFERSRPRLWSEARIAGGSFFRGYDPHPDGERVAVLTAADGEVEEKRDKVVLIENFFELLRQELGGSD